MMVWAIIIIVLVAFVGIMSWMWEELDREDRLRWTDKMKALEHAVRTARTWRIK